MTRAEAERLRERVLRRPSVTRQQLRSLAARLELAADLTDDPEDKFTLRTWAVDALLRANNATPAGVKKG